MIFWEILARAHPHNDLLQLQVPPVVVRFHIQQRSLDGTALPIPQGADLLLGMLSAGCRDPQPAQRPTIVQVQGALEN
eukprot:COSAG04_NODE_7986_length_1038_cov_1.804047_1_plen_77_part_10